VRDHGGQITVRSAEGRGSVFSAYLPALEKGVEGSVGRARPAEPERRTILLVDDDEMVLDVTERILRHLGYRVLRARHGQEAVAIARSSKEKIDVALLDMSMPIMDGETAFPLMRQARPDMKIIICSGYEVDGAAQSLLEAGAVSFVRKPFEARFLESEIRKALGG